MPSGRKPKPTRLKIVEGNPGKRPLPDREPLPKRCRPPCPGFLHKYAKACWRLLVPELDRLGLLTVVDGNVLASYCQAWAEFRLACETLEKEGRYTMRGTGGLTSHPAVQQQRTAWKALRDFAALFGLDPSSRSRLQAPGAAANDPLAEFLGASR